MISGPKNSLFSKTVGGKYLRSKDGKTTSYTFPDNACVEISGVQIPLGGLTVSCTSRMDPVTTKHFSKVTSLISTNKSNCYVIDSTLNTREVGGNGYPNRHEFAKYTAEFGVEYMSSDEYFKLREQNINEKLEPDHPNVIKYQSMKDMISKWRIDHVRRFTNVILNILENEQPFPKDVSLVYEDAKVIEGVEESHAVHIVLSFQSPTMCILKIDNTMSPLLTLSPPHVYQNQPINAETCKECISEKDPTALIIYKNATDTVPYGEVPFASPINSLLASWVYSSYKSTFEMMGIKISEVQVNPEWHNQKMTEECVPFSFENQINYLKKTNEVTNESPLRRGIRLRAQHAILSYLLLGIDNIPYDHQSTSYKPDEWYPNFQQVCKKINDTITTLPIAELNKLMIHLNKDGTEKLAAKFKDLLIDAIKSKCNNKEQLLALMLSEQNELSETLESSSFAATPNMINQMTLSMPVQRESYTQTEVSAGRQPNFKG